MWELDHKEGWVPKNCCFWIVVLEKTLESSLDRRSSNQSILKEISPEYSLEGLMPKLKLQYFGHLMQRVKSLKRPRCWERLNAKRREQQRVPWLDGSPDSMNMNLNKLHEILKDRGAWCAAVHGVTKSRTWLSNWTRAAACPSQEQSATFNPHS